MLKMERGLVALPRRSRIARHGPRRNVGFPAEFVKLDTAPDRVKPKRLLRARLPGSFG